MKPIAIDLFCGLGGWTEGLLAEGYDVIGFDIERHAYGDHRYPAQLVLQDVLTLHGSQFRDAALIVASPPCQEFSYMAMPWTRAKEKARLLREGPPEDRARLTALFDACFRIQREAEEAADHRIPLVVENVRGANEWVGRSRWNFGSFHLWGDVPALMPMVRRVQKFNPDGTNHPSGSWFAVADSKVRGFRFDGSGKSWQSEAVKVCGLDWSKHDQPDYRTSGAGGCFRDSAIKNQGGSWFNIANNTTSGCGRDPDGRLTRSGPGAIADETRLQPGAPHARCEDEGIKARSPGHHLKPGSGPDWFDGGPAAHWSGSSKRKAASALIAKIPFVLASHIARYWHPRSAAA